MKGTISFSWEQSLIIEFMKFCEQNKIDKNQFLAKLVGDKLQLSNSFIKCESCGANYTAKLAKCPACTITTASNDTIREIELKINYYNDQIKSKVDRLANITEAEVIDYLKDQISGYEIKIRQLNEKKQQLLKLGVPIVKPEEQPESEAQRK